jgi:predicted metal-dependent phosphoesterase TrpH
LKIDLHVHTIYSVDSLITPEEVAFYAKKAGLDGVAVTDHDRLDSALTISKKIDFPVVPGVEITSLDGHILSLNAQELVPPGLTAEETIDKIHNSGGIAIACHPAAILKGSLGSRTTSSFDAVEVVNSSAIPFRHSVKRSEQIASRLRIARVAGSDAHYGPEIGYAYTMVDAELNAEDIVNAIRASQCQPHGKAIPLAVRLKREILVACRRRRFGVGTKGESEKRNVDQDSG